MWFWLSLEANDPRAIRRVVFAMVEFERNDARYFELQMSRAGMHGIYPMVVTARHIGATGSKPLLPNVM